MLQLSVEKLTREGAFLLDAGMVHLTEYKKLYAVCASLEQSQSFIMSLYPVSFEWISKLGFMNCPCSDLQVDFFFLYLNIIANSNALMMLIYAPKGYLFVDRTELQPRISLPSPGSSKLCCRAW